MKKIITTILCISISLGLMGNAVARGKGGQDQDKRSANNFKRLMEHMELRKKICSLEVNIYKTEAKGKSKVLAKQYGELAQLRQQECDQMAQTVDKLKGFKEKRSKKQKEKMSRLRSHRHPKASHARRRTSPTRSASRKHPARIRHKAPARKHSKNLAIHEDWPISQV